MPFARPPASSVNFSAQAPFAARPYNGLAFRFQGGLYAAPPGGVVAFAYAAIDEFSPGVGVADFATDSVAPPSAIMVTASTVAPWRRSALRPVGVCSVHKATERIDHERGAKWRAAVSASAESRSPFSIAGFRDSARSARWGMFSKFAHSGPRSGWRTAKRAENMRSAPWGKYGPAMLAGAFGVWPGSVPRDALRAAAWSGFLVPLMIADEYLRPVAAGAGFRVIGSGIHAQSAGGYVAPVGDMIAFVFGGGVYSPPVYLPESANWMRQAAGRGDFYDVRKRVPALDAGGNPVMVARNIDAFKNIPWGRSSPKADRNRPHPWGKYSRPMNPGWGIVVPPGPDVPEPGETVIVPVRRVYIVINEVMLTRVVGTVPIPASALSISFDCDSWLPTFSATVPEAARDAIMPDPAPVEVSAVVNGYEFRFIVEKVGRSRQFGQVAVQISGRGIACELDAPYAAAGHHTNATPMTAQQLIDAALQYTTYAQDWNITDWLVPAGALSVFGTPAAVAGQVAEAAGAVLAAAWDARTLRMLPRYPVKPWDWAGATPDYVIPAAVTQTESLEWVEKPAYNAVYVSGVQSGVLGQVKITGTAGDKPAPMVTHPLITHADAARQRGISILSDTGRKATMQISLPVLDETGVIDVCKLIEFGDGATTRRGIVRANQISVNWPAVRQTLTVEAAA